MSRFREEKPRGDKSRAVEHSMEGLSPDLAPERSPLRRPIRVDAIKDGAESVVEVSDGERREIAALQDLPSLRSLTLDYRLRRVSGGSVRLKGRLRADYAQTCVVTLEPIDARMDMPVELDFWPLSAIRSRDEQAGDVSGDPEAELPEPIIDGVIDLGPVIYESFATALDPYPRAEGAKVEWSGGEGPESDEKGSGHKPFAALERLKKD